MNKKTVVIALGGNALLQRGERLSAENQYKNIAQVANVVGKLCHDYRVIIVHGNGPQVGLLALQNQVCDAAPPYPLDILVAETQGMIGYMIAQQLMQEAHMPPVSVLLTRIEVDANDEAFHTPSKYIGPVYAPEQEADLVARYGWQMKQDGHAIRRVVPSPKPCKILEPHAISTLLAQDHIVICCGGGGIPVAQGPQGYYGVEAVIDKDLAAALLARQVGAEYLMILTDTDAVYKDWGTPQAQALRKVTPDELKPFAQPDGAMGPKAQAVIDFVEQTGKQAFIGALKEAPLILNGEKGTQIIPASAHVL